MDGPNKEWLEKAAAAEDSTRSVSVGDNRPACEICGEPMPENEQMFKFHGYSCPCPKSPLTKETKATQRYNSDDTFSLLVDKIQHAMNETGLAAADVHQAATFLEQA